MTTPPLTPSSPIEPESLPRIRLRWKWSLAAFAVLLGYGMWQCGTAFFQGRELSDAAVRHFHKQFNAGEYEAIYNEADPDFSSTGKDTEFTKFLQAVHRKLGDAGYASLTNIHVNAQPGVTFITTVYNTAFDHGKAAETFTWKKEGAALKLYGYNINSNALIEQ